MTIEVKNNSTWVDITDYFKLEGVDFGRHDVEAPSAGRDMAGLMHRSRVAVKQRLDLQTVPLTNAQTALLYSYILPETVSFRISPYPSTNSAQTFVVYSNEVKVHYLIKKGTGDLYTMSFPLVEV